MEDMISECIKDFLEEFKNKITPFHTKDKDRKNNDKDFNYKIYNEYKTSFKRHLNAV